MGKRSPFEERGAPLWGKEHVHFEEGALLWEKGMFILKRARSFGKGLFQSVTLKA